MLRSLGDRGPTLKGHGGKGEKAGGGDIREEVCIKVCQIGILFVKLAIGPFDEERRLSNEEDQIINWFGKPLTECTGPSVELVRRRRVVRPDILLSWKSDLLYCQELFLRDIWLQIKGQLPVSTTS